MSQKAISEFDAKKLWSLFSDSLYNGILIDAQEHVDSLESTLIQAWYSQFVVKPDQLFGKRGKYGLVWVNLDASGVKNWINEKRQKSQTIKESSGVLERFLIEPFVPHTQEYYIAITTAADHDVIQFSSQGWIDVEENRESIERLEIPLDTKITDISLDTLSITDIKIKEFVLNLIDFFRTYWFSYLEINPFVVVEDGEIVCLDMVARVDTCEAWKQKVWKDIDRIKPFGSLTSTFEEKVEKMDAETGASLKFVTLNPDGNIWLLLGSGGASVAILDTFANAWQLEDIINYGELSWNPNYRHNKEYVQGTFDMLYESASKKQKYLCYLGPIANFTRIDIMWKALVDALMDRVDKIKEQDIKIIVRRGWVNDTIWLAHIEDFCNKHNIEYFVADGEVSIPDAMKRIV